MKTNILIVDDEKLFLDAVIPLFEKRYLVKTASHGQEALEIIRSGLYSPQVVLSDQMMPQMTGLQLFEELLRLQLGHLGRILFTGFGDSELAIDAFNRGWIHNYLQKPITREKMDLLFQYIDRAAELAHCWQEARENIDQLQQIARQSGRDAADGRLQEGMRNFFLDAVREVLQRERQAWETLQKVRQGFDSNPPLSMPSLRGMLEPAEEDLGQNLTMLQNIQILVEKANFFAAISPLPQGRYPLHDLIFSALTATGTLINVKGIQVRTQLLAGEGLFRCVPSDLFCVFSNILTRAARLTPEVGQILIQSEESRGQLMFCFSDSGPKANEELLQKIFEPSGGKEYDLRLCQRILEKYDGHLKASKGPLGGVSLVIELPVG